MNSENLVSVIIPTHNRSKLLEETLQSVIRQLYKNIEIIIVDDGSEDDTKYVVDKYANNINYNITYIYQKNQGAQVARNTGFEKSSGEYVSFFDSDDLWKNTKLLKQVSYLNEHDNIALVFSDCEVMEDNVLLKETFFDKNAPYRGKVFNKLICSNFIPSPTPLIRRSALHRVKNFDESLSKTSGQDWDLWLNIALDNEIDFIDEVLAIYRFHDTNMTKNMQRRLDGQMTVINKYRNLSKLHDDLYEDIRKNILNYFALEYAYYGEPITAIKLYLECSRRFLSFNTAKFIVRVFLYKVSFFLKKIFPVYNSGVN